MVNQIRGLQFIDYIYATLDSFMELRGDRKSGDDRSVIGGLARLNGYKVVVIEYRGNGSVESPKVVYPEGYRKSLRLMQLAEAFGKPVVLLFDNIYISLAPALGQERVKEAIARNLEEMFSLMTPIVAVMNNCSVSMVTEICAADRVIMFERSNQFDTLGKASPDGIDAATSYSSLLDLNIIDRLVKGAPDGSLEAAVSLLREVILEELFQLCQTSIEVLVQKRLHKFQYFQTSF